MIFFFVFSTFLFLIYLYTGFGVLPHLFKGQSLYIAWIVFALGYCTLLAHIYVRVNHLNQTFANITAWIGYPVLGFISLVFWFIFLRDFTLLFFKIVNHFTHINDTFFTDPARRGLIFKISSIGFLGFSGLASAYGIFNARQSPRVKIVTLNVKDRFPDLVGTRIAQFTDLHIGPTIQKNYVKKTIEVINKLKADIIVFTGDLVDGSVKNLKEDVDPLKNLDAPLGKFFVTGNHEYYSGAENWIRYASLLGFDVLQNEHRSINIGEHTITMAGVTDYKAGRFYNDHESDPVKAIKGCEEKSYKILLAHQPKSIEKASKAGFDLQISGHTHGGQYFPYNFLVKLDQPFVKGLYKKENTLCYVSPGTGYWGPPLRIGTFGEITLFKFV